MDNSHTAPYLKIFQELWVFTFIFYIAIHRLSFKLFAGLYLSLQIPMWLFLPAKLIYHEFAYFNLALINVLNSNSSEGGEFLSIMPTWVWGSLVISATLILLTLFLGRKVYKEQKEKPKSWAIYLTSLLLLLGLYGSLKQPYQIIFKKDSELSKGYKGFSRVFDYKFSNNALFVLGSYFYWAYDEVSEIKEQLAQKPSWKVLDVNSKYQDYILVVGESSSADYAALYGYPYENNKFIKSYGKAKIAMNYYSPATNTISSLFRTLLRQDSLNQKAILSDNIINLAKAADIKTYWLSVQNKVQGVDTSIGFVAECADSTAFIAKELFSGTLTKDSQVLPVFEELIQKPSEKTRLIVIHLKGSHPKFAARLEEPLHINHFNENVSEYLQTIEQTDRLIGEIYTLCQRYSDSYSLTYFSDHGMSSRWGSNLSHGNGLSSFHVPFYQLSSDDKEELRFTARKNGLNFIHGFAEWLGLRVEGLDEKAGFFTPTKRDSLSGYHILGKDAYIPFEEIQIAPILGGAK